MPLNPATIQTQIVKALQSSSTVSADQGITSFAQSLTQIIVSAITSADITLPPGSIQVVGSPSAQANAVPLLIPGAIS